MDLGYDPYSKEFKFLNSQTNVIERVPKQRYAKMIESSFGKRLYINGQEYDYEGTDANGKVYLVNNVTKEKKVLSEAEFERNREINMKAFR